MSRLRPQTGRCGAGTRLLACALGSPPRVVGLSGFIWFLLCVLAAEMPKLGPNKGDGDLHLVWGLRRLARGW